MAAEVDGGAYQEATVTVDGGYHSARVLARPGLPMRIAFDRRDEGPCSEQVVIGDAGVEATLTPHATTKIDLPLLDPGTHDFHCGMEMLHGTIEITEPSVQHVSSLAPGVPIGSTPGAPRTTNGSGHTNRHAGSSGRSLPVVPPLVDDCCAVPRPESGEELLRDRVLLAEGV